MIVVDTNVISYFAIPGEKSALADRLRAQDARWCVPGLWRSEFRNVVVGLVRRRTLALEAAQELVALTEAMLRDNEFAVESRPVLARAAASGCTAYDCEFVVLAEELGVPLVTSDRQVLLAFPDRAVALESYVEQ
jgi:predicted nucleic acid-binding protein